ncbi:TetR/AcrR family transcriptional regulator [Nocardioides gilvus]|uniref:TetR/AcrR family transcriptional regulator n=1 Tax=Nocardioides gilvus TaxID=1735589 RepID=UPI000D743FAB|nr:TetR/AcrR family transcriptional regulator [Nocardioides gilvus]
MSSTEPARADGRRNRQLILEAAGLALLDNPQASITEVAERAGVTRATVYRHYADRDALLQAMATETARQIVPALLDELRPLPWIEALDLLAERVVSTGEAYRDIILTVAPQLEQAVRIAVEDEPIQAEIAIRRAKGEVTTPQPDDWMALCMRAVCIAAIGRLADPAVQRDELVTHLAASLRGLAI